MRWATRCESGLEQAFAAANADAGVKAIVLTGTGKFFSAGADISEFKSEMKEPFLPQLIDTIEARQQTRHCRAQRHRLGRRPGAGARLPLPGGEQRRAPAGSARNQARHHPGRRRHPAPAARHRRRSRPTTDHQRQFHRRREGRRRGAGRQGDRARPVGRRRSPLPRSRWASHRGGSAKPRSRRPRSPADAFDKARAGLARHPSGPLAAKAAIECGGGGDPACRLTQAASASAPFSASSPPAPTRAPCSTPSLPSGRRPICRASGRDEAARR